MKTLIQAIYNIFFSVKCFTNKQCPLGTVRDARCKIKIWDTLMSYRICIGRSIIITLEATWNAQ